MIHKKTSKPAFVADLLVKIIKYLYGRDVDELFEELEQNNPDHFAVRQYKKYKLAAGNIK